MHSSAPTYKEEEGSESDDPVVEVDITIDGSSDISQLITTLQTEGSSIETATVKIHAESFVGRSLEEVISLFDAIGSLPSLRFLVLASRYASNTFYELPVQALAALWQKAKHLQTFLMRLMILAITDEDDQAYERYFHIFEQWGNNLQNHQSLREFRIENCRLSGDLLEIYPGALNPVVRGLSTIPTLQYANFYSTENSNLGVPSGESLRFLFQSKTLERLGLRHFPLSAEHLHQICRALAHNTTLIELTLGPCIVKNRNQDESIAQMLRENSTLKRLIFKVECDNDTASPSSLLETAEALKTNVALKDLTIWGSITDESQKAFVTMMQSNYSIENLWIDGTQEQDREEIRFYAGLNEAGRGNILGNTNSTRAQWLDSLILSRNNLDALFYFLSTNPLLCTSNQPS